MRRGLVRNTLRRSGHARRSKAARRRSHAPESGRAGPTIREAEWFGLALSKGRLKPACLDMLNTAYHYLDLVPKGRDEVALAWPMAWVRLRDEYGR
jgi:predicted dithiol-disulfide oxidoreductase (DUF899 family)